MVVILIVLHQPAVCLPEVLRQTPSGRSARNPVVPLRADALLVPLLLLDTFLLDTFERLTGHKKLQAPRRASSQRPVWRREREVGVRRLQEWGRSSFSQGIDASVEDPLQESPQPTLTSLRPPFYGARNSAGVGSPLVTSDMKTNAVRLTRIPKQHDGREDRQSEPST
jgi:hypothetical protein